MQKLAFPETDTTSVPTTPTKLAVPVIVAVVFPSYTLSFTVIPSIVNTLAVTELKGIATSIVVAPVLNNSYITQMAHLLVLLLHLIVHKL